MARRVAIVVLVTGPPVRTSTYRGEHREGGPIRWVQFLTHLASFPAVLLGFCTRGSYVGHDFLERRSGSLSR